MNDWVAKQVREFENLAGRRISSFEGVEMAIREDDGDGMPQFSDPRVPCLQFNRLFLRFDDGAVAEVSTYQDDDEFGLSLTWRAPPSDADPFEGIFRFRQVPELSVGPIDSVTTSLNDRGNLSEVTLFIEDRGLRLLAGEVHETFGDSLVFCRDDESVLVFSNVADVATITWTG